MPSFRNRHLNIFQRYQASVSSTRKAAQALDIENNFTRALVIVLERLRDAGLLRAFLERWPVEADEALCAKWRRIIKNVPARSEDATQLQLGLQGWPDEVGRPSKDSGVLVSICGSDFVEPGSSTVGSRLASTHRPTPDAWLQVPELAEIVFECKRPDLRSDTTQLAVYCVRMGLIDPVALDLPPLSPSKALTPGAAEKWQCEMRDFAVALSWEDICRAATALLSCEFENVSESNGTLAVAEFVTREFVGFLESESIVPFDGMNSIIALAARNDDDRLKPVLRRHVTRYCTAYLNEALGSAVSGRVSPVSNWGMTNLLDKEASTQESGGRKEFVVDGATGGLWVGLTPSSDGTRRHLPMIAGKRPQICLNFCTQPDDFMDADSEWDGQRMARIDLDLYVQSEAVNLVGGKKIASPEAVAKALHEPGEARWNWVREEHRKKRDDWYSFIDAWLERLASSGAWQDQLTFSVAAVKFRGRYRAWRCKGGAEWDGDTCEILPSPVIAQRQLKERWQQDVSTDRFWRFPLWEVSEADRDAMNDSHRTRPKSVEDAAEFRLSRLIRKPALAVSTPTIPVRSDVDLSQAIVDRASMLYEVAGAAAGMQRRGS